MLSQIRENTEASEEHLNAGPELAGTFVIHEILAADVHDLSLDVAQRRDIHAVLPAADTGIERVRRGQRDILAEVAIGDVCSPGTSMRVIPAVIIAVAKQHRVGLIVIGRFRVHSITGRHTPLLRKAVIAPEAEDVRIINERCITGILIAEAIRIEQAGVVMMVRRRELEILLVVVIKGQGLIVRHVVVRRLLGQSVHVRPGIVEIEAASRRNRLEYLLPNETCAPEMTLSMMSSVSTYGWNLPIWILVLP